MRISCGNGGWVQIAGPEIPGPVYVRARDVDGRLRISEVYFDASPGAGVMEAEDIRNFPFRQVEAVINNPDNAWQLRLAMDEPAPPLSVLASYFATRLRAKVAAQIAAGDWVVASLAAQDLPDGVNEGTLGPDDEWTTDGEGVKVKRVRRHKRISEDKWLDAETTFRLPSGPDGALTDVFLGDVARAYASALARGERPNVSIVEQLGGRYPLRTVQGWVYIARQRGIMPRGTKGAAG